MGADNIDKNYELKEENKQLFLEMWGESPDSARWQRDGLYESYYLDDKKMIKLVLLDLRYNRMSNYDSYIAGWITGEFQDMLGENQWKWLENEIKEFNGMYLVIGSSSVFIKDDLFFFDLSRFSYGREERVFLDTKLKVYELLGKYNKNGAFVVSGDIHYNKCKKNLKIL